MGLGGGLWFCDPWQHAAFLHQKWARGETGAVCTREQVAPALGPG